MVNVLAELILVPPALVKVRVPARVGECLCGCCHDIKVVFESIRMSAKVFGAGGAGTVFCPCDLSLCSIAGRDMQV